MSVHVFCCFVFYDHTSTFTDFAPYEKIFAASSSSAAASVGVAANLVKAATGRIDTLLRLASFLLLLLLLLLLFVHLKVRLAVKSVNF